MTYRWGLEHWWMSKFRALVFDSTLHQINRNNALITEDETPIHRFYKLHLLFWHKLSSLLIPFLKHTQDVVSSGQLCAQTVQTSGSRSWSWTTTVLHAVQVLQKPINHLLIQIKCFRAEVSGAFNFIYFFTSSCWKPEKHLKHAGLRPSRTRTGNPGSRQSELNLGQITGNERMAQTVRQLHRWDRTCFCLCKKPFWFWLRTESQDEKHKLNFFFNLFAFLLTFFKFL